MPKKEAKTFALEKRDALNKIKREGIDASIDAEYKAKLASYGVGLWDKKDVSGLLARQRKKRLALRHAMEKVYEAEYDRLDEEVRRLTSEKEKEDAAKE